MPSIRTAPPPSNFMFQAKLADFITIQVKSSSSSKSSSLKKKKRQEKKKTGKKKAEGCQHRVKQVQKV